MPRAPIEATVGAITSHVLAGTFAEWRYTNPVGARQLEGLSAEQIAMWREPTAVRHAPSLETHEDRHGGKIVSGGQDGTIKVWDSGELEP